MIKQFLAATAFFGSTAVAAQDTNNLTKRQLDSSAYVLALQYQNLKVARETCDDKRERDRVRRKYEATQAFLKSKNVKIECQEILERKARHNQTAKYAVIIDLVSSNGDMSRARMDNENEAIESNCASFLLQHSEEVLSKKQIDSAGNALVKHFCNLEKAIKSPSSEEYIDSLVRVVKRAHFFLNHHNIETPTSYFVGYTKVKEKIIHSEIEGVLRFPNGHSEIYRAECDCKPH